MLSGPQTLDGPPPGPNAGLVVLDVDGVVFPGQFIVSLARRRGWGVFLLTVLDCLLFNVGRLSLETLLRRTFQRLKGMPWEEVRRTFEAMRLSPNSAETIAAMRSAGRRVILLTSGGPDELVKDLALRLGADDGAGVHLGIRDRRLTGAVAGELSRHDGKRDYVARLVERDGIPWNDVTAVGDDRNNLPLMRLAGVGIGFHATYKVRHDADVLVEDDDLSAILPYALRRFVPPTVLTSGAGRWPWYREVLRKSIHITAAAVPLAAAYSPGLVTASILFCVGLYLASEFWRLNGGYIPGVHRIQRMVMRRHERRGISLAPLTLALGVLTALWCFPAPVGMACILIAAVADSAAALIGTRWGRHRWPHDRVKSVEGSVAFFVSALVCASVYLPWTDSFFLALIATVFESLPLQDWDNFVTPVGAGLVAAVVMA